MAQSRVLTLLCVAAAALVACIAVANAAGSPGWTCDAPKATDPIVFYSELLGHPNMSDSLWNDQTWAYRKYGPITNLTLYKAWYYDGVWHDPGEFKGLQAWYGGVTNDKELLMGAKRPHYPGNFTLRPSEYITQVTVEWDHIMRFFELRTNFGLIFGWGFLNVDNTTRAVAKPDRPNLYLAAVRGFEGRPLPPWKGGYRKRYISQIQFVWAQLQNCVRTEAVKKLAVKKSARKLTEGSSSSSYFSTPGWVSSLFSHDRQRP